MIKSENDVLEVINCINESFLKPFKLMENEVYINISIGVSLFPENGDTVGQLIKNADIAMYQSKKLAGNSHHFYEAGMNSVTFDSLIIENALYKAIDNKELVIVFHRKSITKRKRSAAWKR